MWEKRDKQWLSDNLGRKLTFSFGSVEWESVLRYNEFIDMYTFTDSIGTEYNAVLCKIWD
jgi:hypothetical protein